MSYKIKVNLGISDCFKLLFLFLIMAIGCNVIGVIIPITIPFLVPFYCLAVLIYSAKCILESIKIIEDNIEVKDQNKKINTKPNSGFSNLKIEELDKIYNSLAGEEEKKQFLKTLNNNPLVKEKENLFKDLPDEVIEELSETDMIAKYILMKRRKQI